MKNFKEIVYVRKDIEEIILNKYSEVKIEDISDYIHRFRFGIEIVGIIVANR